MSLLEMKDITKVFPGVVANDHVSFDLQKGEVHALVGENGAGKTTLMKILYGLYGPDEGSISINDSVVQIANPRDAIRKGIGMVHQHFMLVPVFTVTENIVLGEENRYADYSTSSRAASPLRAIMKWLVLDTHGARDRIQELMDKNQLVVDPDAPVEELSVGLQQRVEILKILFRGAEILVFDEPTAVLTPQEVRDLFETFRELKAQGKGIIFISHKLDEVLDIADRITVVRRGKVIKTMPRKGATKAGIAELMVGKPVLLDVDNPPASPGDVVLQVEHVSLRDERGTSVLHDVSFEIHAGEIYGVAGVEGNGQSELVRAIADRVPLDDGNIRLAGQDVKALDVRQRREAGIAHIPEDRHRFGLLMPFSLADNMSLGRHHRPPFVNRFQMVQTREVHRFAREAIAEFDVRTPSEDVPALALSGGNQQKAIIAREMSGKPSLLLASQPTRGVDIGAQEFIYKQIIAAKKEGIAILLVSADLDEIMSLSDRVGVIYKGRIIKTFDIKDTSKEQVGFYMMGEEENAEADN